MKSWLPFYRNKKLDQTKAAMIKTDESLDLVRMRE